MGENRNKHVFTNPAEERSDGAGKQEKHFDREFVDNVVAGMNSGDFERTAKAYAMLDPASANFERTVKDYAMFDRVSRKLFGAAT